MLSPLVLLVMNAAVLAALAHYGKLAMPETIPPDSASPEPTPSPGPVLNPNPPDSPGPVLNPNPPEPTPMPEPTPVPEPTPPDTPLPGPTPSPGPVPTPTPGPTPSPDAPSSRQVPIGDVIAAKKSADDALSAARKAEHHAARALRSVLAQVGNAAFVSSGTAGVEVWLLESDGHTFRIVKPSPPETQVTVDGPLPTPTPAPPTGDSEVVTPDELDALRAIKARIDRSATVIPPPT